jgi:hypothetical protein
MLLGLRKDTNKYNKLMLSQTSCFLKYSTANYYKFYKFLEHKAFQIETFLRLLKWQELKRSAKTAMGANKKQQ